MRGGGIRLLLACRRRNLFRFFLSARTADGKARHLSPALVLCRFFGQGRADLVPRICGGKGKAAPVCVLHGVRRLRRRRLFLAPPERRQEGGGRAEAGFARPGLFRRAVFAVDGGEARILGGKKRNVCALSARGRERRGAGEGNAFPHPRVCGGRGVSAR